MQENASALSIPQLYVEHRLKAAGAGQAVMTSDAFTMLHEATVGRLRDIDRLVTHALKSAARRKLKLIDRDLILQVIEQDARPAPVQI